MALLFLDSFDHYNSAIQKWGGNSGFMAGITGGGRTGASCLGFGSTIYDAITKPLVTSGGCIVGLAWKTGAFGGVGSSLLEIREGGTAHMKMTMSATQKLEVRNGAGTILATGTTTIPASSWIYIEFKVVIHDTTGSYEVRIDGVQEAALTNAGPIDTRNGATGIWDRVLLGSPTNAGSVVADDFYICDTSGAAPRNTFLGAIRIESMLPQTDAVAAGSTLGLTPSTGTDHGALVDENPPNTTDYNSSAVVGTKDTYNYPPLTLTGVVVGVQTSMFVAKSDAGARQVCPVLRTAGVDNDGANVSPTTTFAYSFQIWPQNPNAGSPIEWTTGDIATIQAGMKVTV